MSFWGFKIEHVKLNTVKYPNRYLKYKLYCIIDLNFKNNYWPSNQFSDCWLNHKLCSYCLSDWPTLTTEFDLLGIIYLGWPEQTISLFLYFVWRGGFCAVVEFLGGALSIWFWYLFWIDLVYFLAVESLIDFINLTESQKLVWKSLPRGQKWLKLPDGSLNRFETGLA